MSAHQWAVFCLLFAGTSPAWASGSPDPGLVVYLGSATVQTSAPLKYMRQELGALMQQAGYRLSVRDLHHRDNADAEFLAVVELNGSCAIPPGSPAANDSTSSTAALATTAMTDGRVLPFSTVNCTALTRLLEPTLRNAPGAQRDFLYGRALARVVAHELYHVMTRTTCHARSGIAKSALSPAELLAETNEQRPWERSQNSTAW